MRTPEERFRAKVKQGAADECWTWTGAMASRGYGVLSVNGRMVYAHRLAWEMEHGKAPKMFVCHRCDNPPCVNPSHLFLGTPADNMRDMTAKGRYRPYDRRGGRNPRAKLTSDQVLEIRARHGAGEPPRKLAPAYGVSRSHVSNIIARRCW